MRVLKRANDNINVLFAGRYPESGVVSGPEMTAKSVFEEHNVNNNSVFLQYFFDGRKYSIFKKLFGRTEALDGRIITLGIFRIIPELRRRHPDIIHLITFERFAVIFYIYKMLFRVKILYNSHGIVRYENSELKKLPAFYRFKDMLCEKIFLKYSDKIIFPSVMTIDLAGNNYSIEENKAVLLPNGVNSEFFSNKLKPDFSGRLKAVMHYKNELNYSAIELLERSLERIEVPIDFFILTDIKISLPSTENITFTVNQLLTVSELPGFYEDKDVFLSLNKYDTFSTSTAEAMASGLIPVVTSQTGISRYIQNGVNGFVFDHYNEAGLPGILKEIAKMDNIEITDIRKNAVKTADELSNYNVYRMYYELYREIAV